MADDTVEYNQKSQDNAVDEDEALILAAKEDVEAFGRLYDKYYKSIFRCIYYKFKIEKKKMLDDKSSSTGILYFN